MVSLMAAVTRWGVQRLVQPVLNDHTPIPAQRKRLDFLQRFAPRPFGVQRHSMTLAGIATERLTPKQASNNKQMLYLHGGAYVTGSMQSHGDLASRVAKNANMTTYLIDYRLAPEHPFPAAMNDALAAYKALADQGDVYVAGDSAGAGLALALTQVIKEAGLVMPKALVLFSPWVDLTFQGDSMTRRASREILLTPEWLKMSAPLYAGDTSLDHPQISPLLAHFEHFPPTLIQVGTEEVLYSDSLGLQSRMLDAGVDVQLTEHTGMWHVFQLHAGYMPEAKGALAEVGEFLSHH